MNIGIEGYLSKYSVIFTIDKVRDWLISYCAKEFKLSIEKKDITIKNGKVRIEGPSALRSELFIRQAEILKALQAAFGDQSPRSVR